MMNLNLVATLGRIRNQVMRISCLITLSMILLFSYEALASQSILLQDQKTVTGMITDLYTGEPLAGVTVMVVGTATMVRSEKDGTYCVEIQEDAAELLYSYPEYQTLQIAIGDRTKIQVTMSPNVSPQESELWDM